MRRVNIPAYRAATIKLTPAQACKQRLDLTDGSMIDLPANKTKKPRPDPGLFALKEG
jgi:hypothetical protein